MTLSDKAEGDKLTAAEWNEVVDMIETGDLAIDTASITAQNLPQNRIPFADADNKLVSTTDLEWDNTAKSLKVNGDLDHDGDNAGFFSSAPVAQQGPLTAKDGGTVDSTYGTAEADVIKNNRTRIEEVETALKNLGLIS